MGAKETGLRGKGNTSFLKLTRPHGTVMMVLPLACVVRVMDALGSGLMGAYCFFRAISLQQVKPTR